MAENAKNLRKMPTISSEEEACFKDVRHANAFYRLKRLIGNSLELMKFKGKTTEATRRLSI
jgi:hypothetical protein